MKKMLLGLAAVFALSVAVPAYAADAAKADAPKDEQPAKEKPVKKAKKGGKKEKEEK